MPVHASPRLHGVVGLRARVRLGGSGRGGGRKRGGVALATGAGPGEQAALESRVEEIQLEVRVLSRKKQIVPALERSS